MDILSLTTVLSSGLLCLEIAKFLNAAMPISAGSLRELMAGSLEAGCEVTAEHWSKFLLG